MTDMGSGRRSPLPPFWTRLETVAGYTVVVIGGELDLHSRARAEAALFTAQAVAGPKGVVADLTRARFVGVLGLNVLVAAARSARAEGIAFAVVPGRCERMIDLCGLREQLDLCEPLVDPRRVVAD